MTKSRSNTRLTFLLLATAAALPSLTSAQVPVFKVDVAQSKITFFVKASVALQGDFNKWDSSLVFTSPDLSTGVLKINIQADSVSTGSGMKDGKLKSEDFFDVKNNPQITFVSKKISMVGPDQFQIDGDFTIRGETKPESLTLDLKREADNAGRIQGQMAFDRRDYGMNKGIPFIKIADRVEVNVDLKAHRVSGPRLNLPKAAAPAAPKK